MPLLSPAQLAQLQQIIRDASTSLGISTFGMQASPEDLQRLAAEGYLDPAHLTDLAMDSFAFGTLMSRLPKAKDMTLDQFKAHLEANPLALSPEQQAAVDVARDRGGRYCVGLGDTYSRKLNEYVTVADAELAKQRRDLIADKTAWAIEEDKGRKSLAAELRRETGDMARNWERIASTEMHLAHQEGFFEATVKQHGTGELLAKIPEPSACEDCKRLYLEDGVPMIRPASWWEEQGISNVGKKRQNWAPVLGAMHPWCQCQLVRVPRGWEFTEDWDLVPPGMEKAADSFADSASLSKADAAVGAIHHWASGPHQKQADGTWKPVAEVKPARVVYLVSCVGQKKEDGAAAEDLYQSDWFLKAKALAKKKGDAWMILSAEHGVVQPGQHLQPYDTTLNTMSEPERRAWAAGVAKGLKSHLKPTDHVVVLAGENYRKHLMAELGQTVARVDVPMAGLGIGEQKAWLKREAEKGVEHKPKAAPEQLDLFSMPPRELAKKAADPVEWGLPAGARVNDPWERKPKDPEAHWQHPDFGKGRGEAPWEKEGWEPDLHKHDFVIVNTSAGKDSQAMMANVVEMAKRQNYPLEKLVAVHADLGRAEWAGTLELAREQAEHYGLRFEVVTREKNDLIDQIEQRYGTLLQRQVDTARLLGDGKLTTWKQLSAANVEDVIKLIDTGASTSEWTAAERAKKMIWKAGENLKVNTEDQEEKRGKARIALSKAEERLKVAEAKAEGSTRKADLTRLEKAQAALAKAQARLDDLAVDYADQTIDFGAPIPWPSSNARFCTSDHKAVEVSRLITALAGEFKERTGKPARVLNAMGIRAQESDNREKMTNFSRQTTTGNQIVDRWYPIHDWHEERVWKEILDSKVPFHKAYRLGMRRLSCVFCVYASREDLMVAATHNPKLFQVYLELEKKVGSEFRSGQSLADVRAEIQARRDEGYELNELAEWIKKSFALAMGLDLIKAELEKGDDAAAVAIFLEASLTRLRKQGHEVHTMVIEWKAQGACFHLDTPKDSIHADFVPYPTAYNASLMAAAFAQRNGLGFEEHNAPGALPGEDADLEKSRRLHGRMMRQGFEISIENRVGSVRRWYDKATDTQGETKMTVPYGYIRRTLGMDGDHVDVFVGPDKAAAKVYVVHQMKAPDFKVYDEDKVMLGFGSEAEARAAYLKHFDKPGFLGSITAMDVEEFRQKVYDAEGEMIKAEQDDPEILKAKKTSNRHQLGFSFAAGPFIGPRGGKWADAAHTIPWGDQKSSPSYGPFAQDKAWPEFATSTVRQGGRKVGDILRTSESGKKPSFRLSIVGIPASLHRQTDREFSSLTEAHHTMERLLTAATKHHEQRHQRKRAELEARPAYTTPERAETERKVFNAGAALKGSSAVFVNVSGGSEKARLVPVDVHSKNIASQNVHAQITAHEVPRTKSGRERYVKPAKEQGLRVMIDSGEFGRFSAEQSIPRLEKEWAAAEPKIPAAERTYKAALKGMDEDRTKAAKKALDKLKGAKKALESAKARASIGFEQVFKRYKSMAEEMPPGTLTIVAADKIGEPEETVRLREQWAKPVRQLQQKGVELIVPIQANEESTPESFGQDYIRAEQLFGESFVIGIPSAKKPPPMATVVLPAMVQLYAHGKFPKVHFLGGGRPEMMERMAQLVTAAYFAGQDIPPERVLELCKTPDSAARAFRNVVTSDVLATRVADHVLAERMTDWTREVNAVAFPDGKVPPAMDPDHEDFDETEAWPAFYDAHPEEFTTSISSGDAKEELFRTMARDLVQSDTSVVSVVQQHGQQHDPITGVQVPMGEDLAKLPKAERHPGTLQAYLEAKEHQTERFAPPASSAWGALWGDFSKAYYEHGLPNTGPVGTMGNHSKPARSAGQNIESGGVLSEDFPVGKDKPRRRIPRKLVPPQIAMDVVGNPEKHGWSRPMDLDAVEELDGNKTRSQLKAGERFREQMKARQKRHAELTPKETFTPRASQGRRGPADD